MNKTRQSHLFNCICVFKAVKKEKVDMFCCTSTFFYFIIH